MTWLYEAIGNGPGCGNLSLNENECRTAPARLGYTGVMNKGNWGHAPYGCHVGTPSDGWKHTYFNENQGGKTGNDIYRSICKIGT